MSPSTPRATERLRAEHASLRREAARLPRVAADISEWTAPDTPDQLQQIRGFLSSRLLPHAASEEAVLYPLLDKVMGAEQSTATMVADHAEIHERSDALAAVVAAVGQGPPSPAEAEALREHLYALWAIVRLHLDKEEKILFSLLDARLSSADVQTLEQKMAAFSGHAPA